MHTRLLHIFTPLPFPSGQHTLSPGSMHSLFLAPASDANISRFLFLGPHRSQLRFKSIIAAPWPRKQGLIPAESGAAQGAGGWELTRAARAWPEPATEGEGGGTEESGM